MNSHGGKRKGAGRPETNTQKKTVSFWCRPSDKEKIKQFIKTLDK